MSTHILPDKEFVMNTLSKGSIKIIEYADPKTDEPIRTYVQNGILGFWVTEKEMNDLLILLNYYVNIEEVAKIT